MKIPRELLNKIKDKLLKKKEKMEQTLSSIKLQDPFSDPERVIDNAASDTEAKEESSHDRIEALEKELEHSIADIDEALERISSGTYGLCQSCGKLINQDRLAIKPTALYCMGCKKEKKKQ